MFLNPVTDTVPGRAVGVCDTGTHKASSFMCSLGLGQVFINNLGFSGVHFCICGNFWCIWWSMKAAFELAAGPLNRSLVLLGTVVWGSLSPWFVVHRP